MVKVLKYFEPLTIAYLIYISTNFVVTEVWTTGLKRQNGLRMKDHVLESITGLGYIMCIRECRNRGNCVSISYNRQGLICELYWSGVHTESDRSKILTDPLFTYVDMTDVPSSLTPECLSTTNCGPTKAKCVQLKSRRTVCIDPVITTVGSTTVAPVTTQHVTSVTTQPVTSVTTQPVTVTSATTQPVTSATTQPVKLVTTQPVTLVTTQPVTSVSKESMSTVSTETHPSTPSISTLSTTSTCPALYTRSENNKFCISLEQTQMSRDKAKYECQKTANSSLLLIESEETQNDVSTFLANHINSNFPEKELWIDGTYNDQASEWSSSSGPLTFVNWKSNASPKKNKNCILLTISNGKWKPSDCTKQNYFLCQIHIT
ncbi:location of vulva defective 1-like [Ostrea edulis]|uniref:location of vulva defective 1-like n=1 Tax=Ostrea edulis TaxID=37623 RepID=UPI0024AFC702|nr:location of vulva defective 1-like [Ostrea edulis]